VPRSQVVDKFKEIAVSKGKFVYASCEEIKGKLILRGLDDAGDKPGIRLLRQHCVIVWWAARLDVAEL